ncbi:CTP:tRNA cytidylyltransferase [Aureococcus anophagefferens]|nr:CTP:tRNA cytidylyltransferase [Aureococcus anophagefferens]
MTATVESADLANAFVELTKEEAELVEVLCAAAAPTGTTVRICGGWVRDKALGRVTKDVDVALDNVSGAAFAARVSEALAARGGDRGSNIGVIAANPEQSKHLETATMRLCGIEVDFVNLRSESYADAGDTRIPTMTFGTPEQDALRRDFTLNALFFNVHSRAIEDYTKRGWDDLRTGIMRRRSSSVTLLDDPRSAACASRAATASPSSRASSGPASCRSSASSARWKRDATLAALAAALLPLSGDDAFVVDKKKRRTPLPSAVCKDGLKLPGRTVQDAQKVLDAAFASLAKRLDAKLADDGAEPWGDLRRDAGLHDAAAFPGGNNVVALDWTEPNPAAAHFDALEAAILGPQLHLDGVWDALTPLLDGNKMSAALGPYRMISAAAILVTNVHGDEPEHTIVVV